MAVFVQIEPDAFNKVFSAVTEVQKTDDVGELENQKLGLYHHVRRPVRGIQIKNDTYATIQVRRSNGIAIPLFDAGSRTNTGKGIRNSNFIIQSISEQRAEKQQVILTFGEPYIFFFGEQPRMITVSGVLLNTEDFNWRAEWWANYEQFLRGTQCVRQRTRAYLSWDDIVVEGYITQANSAEDASNQNLVQFQFQMFLTNYQNISDIGGINAHWAGKEIALDPSTIQSVTGPVSSTALVRQRNLQNDVVEGGKKSSTLFEFLRQGPTSAAAGALVSIQGQVVDIMSIAGQFVSGRNLRVPVGFEGAAAFDQQVQLAIESIPGAQGIISGSENNRIVTLQPATSGLVKEFRAVLANKFGIARNGLPLSANEDEYVARINQDETSAEKVTSIFSGQTASDQKAAEEVRNIFAKFGLDPNPPSKLTTIVKKATFGVLSVVPTKLIQNNSNIRNALNTPGV